MIHDESSFYQCCTDILTDKKWIAAVIECLESILAVIKRLDDVDNYRDWSLQVKTYLTNRQLLDIVENDEAAFEAWSEKNAMALVVILFSCGYRLRFAIWGITTAKVTWDTLVEICEFHKSDYIGISRSLSKKCTCSWSNIFKVGYVVYIYIKKESKLFIKKKERKKTQTRIAIVKTWQLAHP